MDQFLKGLAPLTNQSSFIKASTDHFLQGNEFKISVCMFLDGNLPVMK